MSRRVIGPALLRFALFFVILAYYGSMYDRPIMWVSLGAATALPVFFVALNARLFLEAILNRLFARALARGVVRRRSEGPRPWLVWTIFFNSRLMGRLLGRVPLRATCAICGRSSYRWVRYPLEVDPVSFVIGGQEIGTHYREHRHPGQHSEPSSWELRIPELREMPRDDFLLRAVRARVVDMVKQREEAA